MRHLLRISFLIFLIGIAILIITLIRSSPSTTETYGSIIERDASEISLPPSEIKLNFFAEEETEMFFLDKIQYDKWDKNSTPSLYLERLKVKNSTSSFTLSLEKRGKYYIVILPDKPTTIKYVITIYGFEKDLLNVSFILISVGLFFIYVSILKETRKSRT